LRLLGKPLLQRLTQMHPGTRTWASSWASEIAAANWKQAADVRVQFPKVVEPSPNQFTFPVAESSVAVALSIAFPQGVAVITHLVNQGDNA
jgi:mRNA-degrading endonuclease HigB of HigAB toxin-antitoxin module